MLHFFMHSKFEIFSKSRGRGMPLTPNLGYVIVLCMYIDMIWYLYTSQVYYTLEISASHIFIAFSLYAYTHNTHYKSYKKIRENPKKISHLLEYGKLHIGACILNAH